MDRKQLIAVIAVVAIVVVAAGSYAVLGGEKKDVLIVETSPDFAPFDYMYGSEFVGIDMDIVRAVCDDMGYKVEFRQNSFDSILMSVPQGKADIGASGFTISEERAKSVNFSIPYASINQVVVAPVDTDIKTLEDVRGKVISVQNGTTGADYAAGVSSSVIYQKTYSDVILDVSTGKADCEIVDSTVAVAQIAAHPELQVLDILTDSPVENYGFIFSKDNQALLDKFNASLQKIMDNGIYESIWNYYEKNGFSPETPSFFSYRGVLTVETSPDFPPFEYIYGTEYAGIDMDLMQAICYDINYRLVMKDNNFDSIIMSVTQGKSDMGASGFTISEDRKKQVLFSDPYAEIKQVVVVSKDSNIKTLDDVRGKTISVQTGTSGADYAATLSSNIIYQKTYSDVVQDILTGKADCEVVDSTVAAAQAARNSNLRVLDITDAEVEYYGFIFAKESQELCDLINESLARLTANGTVDKIIAYYADNEYKEVPSYYSSHDIEEFESHDGFWGGLWDRINNDFLKNDRYQYLFKGLENTLIITVIALLIGMALGAIVAMIRSTHDITGKFVILNAISKLYVTVIRGTPVMVQLMIIYYVVFASINFNPVLIASVAFGLNSGAYVAEVIRSGINAVPKGQMEACRSLGMSNRMAMTTVILPQAIRNILPALGNEGITLLKETSVAGYIGIMDLTRGGDIIRGQTYDALLPMVVVAVIYLAIVLVLTKLVGMLEKRLNNAY